MGSDFVSSGWSYYVAAITIGGLVFCALLLALANRRKAMSDDNTTGHVWDVDLVELNNPLPRWWLWLFVITVVFAVVYLVLYPGLGSNPGTLKWTSVGQWQTEQQRANTAMAPVYEKFAAMNADQLAKDAQAMGIGERLFANNCAGCHGSDARGSKGFPNLADADWLHGGTPEKIRESIEKGRIGNMPPLAAAVGSPEDVRNLSHYVLSLSGSPHDSLRASLGKAKFAACAACHGMDGKGNQALGAPNLTDDIWLHGWGEATITAMINNGKVNEMPAQAGKLTEAQIGVLSAYVWGLSGRQQAAAQ